MLSYNYKVCHFLKSNMKALAVICLLGVIISIAVTYLLTALDSIPDKDIDVARPLRSPNQWPTMGSQLHNIFWIVQVSDIHISAHRDLARGPDLIRFCNEYIKEIDPELVIITGDLTDAKDETNIVSIQNVKEWESYHDTVHQCKATSRAKWLDIRGNHDAFDVMDFKSKNNHYRRYSVFGRERSEEETDSYHYKLALPFGNYSFIGFDASVAPGSNRPFNFFGYLNDKQIRRLQRFSDESYGSNHSVWFAHFPSSVIVHDPPILRSIMRRSIALLSGHLHTLGGMVPHMYSRQKTGQLELELGDWKENRMFRVIAFDHDLMSFTDARLGDWPLIILTNPKNSQFYSPNKEPVEMVIESTHIRILVFSPEEIDFVLIKINGMEIGEAEHVQGPLYVKAWDPVVYGTDTHLIEIIAKDDAGREKRVVQHFSMEEIGPEFRFWPRFILMLNIFSMGKVVFGILVFSYTFLLASLHQCSGIRRFFIHGVPLLGSCFNGLLMRVWLVSQVTSLYYIVIGCVLYLTFGPWFYGDLLREHSGAVFVWGIIFENTFIPSGITFFYGIFQMLTFNIPLLLLVGHILECKRRLGHSFKFMKSSSSLICSSLLLLLWIYITLKEFPTAYGRKALLFGPLRLSCVFLIPISIRLAVKHEFKYPNVVNGNQYHSHHHEPH